MSQSGGPIGEARIDFKGNVQPLEQAAKKAVEVTKQAAAQAQAAASGAAGAAGAAGSPGAAGSGGPSGVSTAVAEIGEKAEAANGGLMNLLRGFARLSGVIGILSGVSAWIAKIHDNLTGAEARAAAFYRTLEGQGPLQQQKALAEQINKTYEALIRAQGNAKELITGGVQAREREIEALKEIGQWTDALAQKETDRNNKSKDAAAAKEQQAKIDKDTEQRAARLADIEKRYRAAEKSAMDEEARIRADEEDQVAELDELRRRASEEERARIDQTEAHIRAAGERRLREYKARVEQQKRADADAAQAQERAFAAAIQGIARQLQNAAAFGNNGIVATLDEMKDILTAIRNQNSIPRG